MGQALLPAVLVEEPLEFEFKNGMFYVAGPNLPVRAMRPNTFFATVAAAAAEGRKFGWGSAEVVPFPVKDAAEH